MMMVHEDVLEGNNIAIFHVDSEEKSAMTTSCCPVRYIKQLATMRIVDIIIIGTVKITIGIIVDT